MTNETARREARAAAVAGFCGFCFQSGSPLRHRTTCKLVVEHGRRIGLGPRAILPDEPAEPAPTHTEVDSTDGQS